MATSPSISLCNILNLPDDIIRLLFSYLPTLTDCVSFARVTPAFESPFDSWAKSRSHTLNAEDIELMPLPDVIEFFALVGRYLTVLNVNCASFEKESLIVEFIACYCPNLEEIYYTNVTDVFRYRQLLSRLTKLRSVSIICMDAEDVLNFDLSQNRELESFELVNGCYTGKNLCGFPNLHKLVLRDCLLWSSGEFGIPLKNLRYLDLDDCCFEVMNQSLYHKIAECCLELEELLFSGCDTNFEVIAQLPRLRRCSLKTWVTSNDLSIGFLASLAERKGHKLMYLKLTGHFNITNEHARCIGQLATLQEMRWYSNDLLDDDHIKYFSELQALEIFALVGCGRITDIGLIRLLQNCPQLYQIDLKDCDCITEQFVHDAITCCGRSAGRRLHINVCAMKITEGLLKHEDYNATANKVKLNFTEDII